MNGIKYLLISGAFFFISCNSSDNAELPYLGTHHMVDGIEVKHSVGRIAHFNQDSTFVNNDSLNAYIHIADFFFTSCPSICPKVMKEMLKIYEATSDLPHLKIISYTIDPTRDDVDRLNIYSKNLGIDNNRWYFLTGDKSQTFALANSYFVPAFEDPDAPGGFDHSGKIILVDPNGHVRGFTEGTDPSSTDAFIEKIRHLHNNMFPHK